MLFSESVNKALSNSLWLDKKSRIQTNPNVTILSKIFSDELAKTDEISPSYIKNRGEKIAKNMVNGIFKKFIAK